jgi:predicted DsbA family dithiol-disulfide isomerase
MRFIPILFFTFFSWFANGQSQPASRENTPTKAMTVEIWSDVMCPFCYIGKRKFEAALAQFAGKDSVRVIWRSYQLDPDLQTDTTKSVAQSLSEKKAWSAQQTSEMIDYVRDMAKTVQLDYHFDKAVVANSFDAHRFSHYALKHGKQIEAEEKLFSAYFTEGKNIADHQTLAEIGTSIGLDAKDILQSLSTDANKKEVNDDLALARQFGITGVPFFVFNRKMAVSGAQEVQVFLQTLQKAAGEQ